MKKFLLIISLSCLFSIIFNLRVTSNSFLNDSEDELESTDTKLNEYENESNNELEKEDKFDKNQNEDMNDSSNGDDFNEKALKDEIHHDIGSEKVSYKFDD